MGKSEFKKGRAMPWVYWNLLSTPMPLIICILRLSGGLRGKGADLSFSPGNLCRSFDSYLAASGLVSFRRTMVVGHQRCNVEIWFGKDSWLYDGMAAIEGPDVFVHAREANFMQLCSVIVRVETAVLDLCHWEQAGMLNTGDRVRDWVGHQSLALLLSFNWLYGKVQFREKDDRMGWFLRTPIEDLQTGTLDPSIWNPPGKSRSEACDLTVIEAWRCPNSRYFLFWWNKTLHLKDAGKNKKRGPELKCAALKLPIPWSTQRREHV